MIIAIDGPAASGKGAIARRVAEKYAFHYLDTGLLYRGVARDVIASGYKLDDPWAATIAAKGIDPGSLSDSELRGERTGEAASVVARIPQVRAALARYQRAFAARPPGAVLDGRDIGTVICPDAPVKIFVTATPEVRAERRYRERIEQQPETAYEDVLADILRRDRRDTGRTASPLKPAGDACLLDTTALSIEAAFEAAVRLIQRKIGQ